MDFLPDKKIQNLMMVKFSLFINHLYLTFIMHVD